MFNCFSSGSGQTSSGSIAEPRRHVGHSPRHILLATFVLAGALSAVGGQALAGGVMKPATNPTLAAVTDPLMQDLADAARAAEEDALGARQNSDGVRLAVEGALMDQIRQRIAGGTTVSEMSIAFNRILATRCVSQNVRSALCPLSANVRGAASVINAQLMSLYSSAPSSTGSRVHASNLALPLPPAPALPGAGYR